MSATGPANPTLVCDSDVLVQVFLTCGAHAFRWLKSRYGIDTIITEVVDTEMRWVGRFHDRFEKDLQKAINTGLLIVADSGWAGGRSSPSAVAASAFSTYQSLGVTLSKRVDDGEAHTHALAHVYGLIALTNDQRAVDVLLQHGYSTSSPILRFFDLICLAHQAGEFDASACNSICKALRAEGEGLHKDFERSSFDDGLKAFVPRIYDSTVPLIGSSGSPTDTRGIAARLAIRPLVA